MDFTQLPNQETITKTTLALEANGFVVKSVQTGKEAKDLLFSLIPEGAEVMRNTSVTLDTIGFSEELHNSKTYGDIHAKALTMDREKQDKDIKKLRSVPDVALGSVHAITEDGHLLIASNSGSQLPGYVYGAGKVILVVGAQKLVKDLDTGIKRIYEYTLPLESERMRKTYNMPDTWNSFPSKILMFNKEPIKDRTTVIIVNEVLGF